LPILTTLAELTEEQLVSILTEPKSALTKQYAKLMAMEAWNGIHARRAARTGGAGAQKRHRCARLARVD